MNCLTLGSRYEYLLEATVSRRTSLTAATLAASLVLAGCASANDDSASGNGETSRSATTSEPASPTSTASSPRESPDASNDGDSPEASASESIPTDPVDYADALVQAWGLGDEDRMSRLASDEVVDDLTGVAMPGGSHWDQTGADAGAGSSFVSYTNTENGATVDLRVENETASAGEQHAVVEAKTGG